MRVGRRHPAKMIARIAMMVMLAAVLVRGITPSGFMIDRNASDGTILVRMCAAAGPHGEPVYERLALPNGEEEQDEADRAASCPFALATAPAIPASRVEAPAPSVERAEDAPPGQPRLLLPPKRGPPPPARGPPLSA